MTPAPAVPGRSALDGRERFLREIADRLPPERVSELHLFPAIRQGGIESAIAVIAVEQAVPSAGAGEVMTGAGADDGTGMPAGAGTGMALGADTAAASAAGTATASGADTATASAAALERDARRDGDDGGDSDADADLEVDPRRGMDVDPYRETGPGVERDATDADDAEDSDSDAEPDRTPGLDGGRHAGGDADTGQKSALDGAPDTGGAADSRADLEGQNTAAPLSLAEAIDAPACDPTDAAAGARPARRPLRHTVYTARYRHTLKGAERGKWEFDLVAEAEAPLVTVDAVVRGVQKRTGELVEPERLTPDELRLALEDGPWRATTG